MSTPLNAVVGDVHIAGGVRQPMTAPTATLQSPRGAAHGRTGDRLFVLVELHSTEPGAPIEPHNKLYSKIIDQIAQGYWRTKGSVTAALRDAIALANNWLLDYNLESPVRERFNAGIVCVTMRDTDVFIAQAGPSACYVAHQGHAERFPSRDVTTTSALGSSRGCEIRYGHAELHHGDVVLLCDSRTAERVADATIANAIVYVGTPAALANLERLAGPGDLIALVIEGAAAGEPIQVSAPPAAAPRPAPKLPPVVQPDLVEGGVVPEIARPLERSRLGDGLSSAWARLRRPVLPRAALQDRARQVTRSVILGFMVAGQEVKTFFQRILPESAQRPSRPTPANPLIMAGLVILIPFLVTLLVVYGFMQHRQQVEFESLLNSARGKVALAQSTLDPQAVRAHWQTAWQDADDALSYKPGDVEALAVREQARGQLDQIDQVTRVKAAFLMDFGASAAYRLVAQGANVFVLNSNYLWHVTLNETGTSLLEGLLPPASAYASASVGDRQIGELLDLVWVSAQGLRTKSSLLVLDAGGLLEYDPAWNVRTVALGQDSAQPGSHLMGTFGGNLYVLDTSQLLRYKPVGDGFGTVAETYFNAPPGDLGPVVDLAIDGSVYLLYPTGQIRKFFGGDEQSFTPTGLPDPLVQAVALAVDAETMRGSLYVADAGRARVIQFTPNGIFVRQIKTYDDSMNDLENIAVDERAQRLFFLSDGKLYAAPLAPVQGQ